MTGPKILAQELHDLLKHFTKSEIEQGLHELASDSSSPVVCTILVNEGLHTFPKSIFRGEVFVFYEGSADISSEEAFEKFTMEHLRKLAIFLRGKKWEAIDIVISGHAAICMQVKLAVYRITHLETTDWVFDGKGRYFPLRIPLRAVISSAAKSNDTAT